MFIELSGKGMMWPFLLIFFTHVLFFNFCKKNTKIEARLCPLPSEEVLEDILEDRLDRTMWESLRIEIPGEDCTSLLKLITFNNIGH